MVARLDRLPPNARVSADQPRRRQAASVPGRTRSRREITGEGRWRCSCGDEFTAYTGKKGAEAHADELGHHRIDVVLG